MYQRRIAEASVPAVVLEYSSCRPGERLGGDCVARQSTSSLQPSVPDPPRNPGNPTHPNPTTHRSALSLAATVLRLYVPTVVLPLMHTGGADVLEHQIVQRSTTCCGVSGALSDWTQGEVLEGFVLMILDADVAALASAVRNYTDTLAVPPPVRRPASWCPGPHAPPAASLPHAPSLRSAALP